MSNENEEFQHLISRDNTEPQNAKIHLVYRAFNLGIKFKCLLGNDNGLNTWHWIMDIRRIKKSHHLYYEMIFSNGRKATLNQYNLVTVRQDLEYYSKERGAQP